MVKSDLKDPLIDLEAHDVVDIIRIYATFAQSDDHLLPDFVPKLFSQPNQPEKKRAVVKDQFSSESGGSL